LNANVVFHWRREHREGKLAETGLVPVVVTGVASDIKVDSDAEDIGFVHRKLDDADIYFIANTSNHPVHTVAAFRAPRQFAAWWNPFDGSFSPAERKPWLDFAPYESRVLVFTDKPRAVGARAHGPVSEVANLNREWMVAFPQTEAAPAEAKLEKSLSSWSDEPRTRFFRGVAVYTKDFELTETQMRGRRMLLDFGEGAPVTDAPKAANGMRAMLESPVREAAVVLVNGIRAGSVWYPPYSLDITSQLHPGVNHLEIRVGNLGINALAGRAPTDYRLLNSRYGTRFVPQDMENLMPLPSGILV